MSHDIAIAKVLADKYHAGQMYGKDPYTAHLEQVAYSVAEGTTDERMVVVAWLHDILEYTDCSVEALRILFEDNIVDAVIAITRPQDMEKQLYLQRCKANPMARMVKIHDSLCNLRASVMRFDSWRIQKYAYQINYLAS